MPYIHLGLGLGGWDGNEGYIWLTVISFNDKPVPPAIGETQKQVHVPSQQVSHRLHEPAHQRRPAGLPQTGTLRRKVTLQPQIQEITHPPRSHHPTRQKNQLVHTQRGGSNRTTQQGKTA